MLTKRWAVLCCIAAAVVVFPISGWATFTMNNMGMDISGSGQSESTATIVSEDLFFFLEPGFNNNAGVFPTGPVTSFQQSSAEAWDGTAGASTGGAIVNTGDVANDGDSVTATTSGSTGATAQKENDLVQDPLSNSTRARLIASGGAGAVNNNYFDISTGYMMVDSNARAASTGSTDAAAGAYAVGNSKGAAGVEYTFSGQPGPETTSLANADVAATADIDGDTAVDSYSYAFNDATAAGVIGWTDTETTGQAFGSFLNPDSETFSFRQGDPATDGFPSSTADAAGSLDLNFVYRPLAPATVFSFAGNVNGSTDSETGITQGLGTAFAQGIKAAVGSSGAQTDLPTGVPAWIVGSDGYRSGR